jgi:hypothetical protein
MPGYQEEFVHTDGHQVGPAMGSLKADITGIMTLFKQGRFATLEKTPSCPQGSDGQRTQLRCWWQPERSLAFPCRGFRWQIPRKPDSAECPASLPACTGQAALGNTHSGGQRRGNRRSASGTPQYQGQSPEPLQADSTPLPLVQLAPPGDLPPSRAGPTSQAPVTKTPSCQPDQAVCSTKVPTCHLPRALQ